MREDGKATCDAALAFESCSQSEELRDPSRRCRKQDSVVKVTNQEVKYFNGQQALGFVLKLTKQRQLACCCTRIDQSAASSKAPPVRNGRCGAVDVRCSRFCANNTRLRTRNKFKA
jgi:hypothetical protein